jgi:hypothetical protein
MDRKKAFSPYIERLSDFPTRTEEEKRIDDYGVRMMMDGIRREMEEATALEARKSTKH